ncbi:unnamed protein product [Caenorhabditis auriculariae]|uniref:Ephrin RBD domain-containing protein n=1 Tax=Caenorhabditis auriculariae TaxID=2777116 RepID=A0A8S1HUN7_9PELO|nr:unnamed protein product [Caenorhabditis auriculariae]
MRAVLSLLFIMTTLSVAKRLPEIYWNSTNPLVERYAAIGDTLDILCPTFDDDVPVDATEQAIIYRVTEEEYETCQKRSTAKELGRCTTPYGRDKIKVAFRVLSPNPSGLTYRTGTTYYFISTSTGPENGLYNEQGGLCASHNLKMVIHVTDKNGDIAGHSRRHHHHKTSSTSTTTTEEPATAPPLVPFRPYRPTASAAKLESDSDSNEHALFSNFYEKVLPMENGWREPTRAQRVTLGAGPEAGGEKNSEYEATPDGNQFHFIIHDIGEVESLYASSSLRSLSSVLLTFAVVLLLRLD